MSESHRTLVPYRPEWRQKFEAEKEKLKVVFGTEALEIEHIGSTSIEGMPSKPIVDIAVLIESCKDAERFNDDLEKIGYISYMPGNERNFFIKGDPIKFHLSIAYTDRGGFWERQILFRDYLRDNPEARDEYAELKRKLLENDPSGVGEYIRGKEAFVLKILRKAGWKGDRVA